MANTSLVVRLLSASVAVSHKAGRIIRDILKTGDLGIVEKGINDLQTEADRSVQRCIVASLSKNFPTVSIIGEETLEPEEHISMDMLETGFDPHVLKLECPNEVKNAKDKDIVVWVDPLDGTSEFTEGFLDHVTVLIGVAVRGRATAGVVYQPYYDYKNTGDGQGRGRCLYGIVGLGAFQDLGDGPVKFLPNLPGEGRIVATTRSHSTKEVVEAYTSVDPTEVIKVGGAGHKVVLVLEGRAHAYIFGSPGCKKWDTCAPEALLHSVGGKLTDIHGKEFRYHVDVQQRNTGGVLATLMTDQHAEYAAKIPASVKAKLPSDPECD